MDEKNAPKKNWAWIKNKYFHHKKEGPINNKWVFHATLVDNKDKFINIDMLQLKWYPHTDWTMLAHSRSPYNVEDNEYFKKLEEVFHSFDKKLANQQKHTCPVCGDSLWNGHKLHKHPIVAKSRGGKDTFSNIIILHLTCHYRVHNGPDQQYWSTKFQQIKKDQR